MALEAGDRPVPGAGSQLGWLLWADALEPTRATPPPSACAGPTSSPASGLRTLSARARRCSARTPTTAARSGRSTRGSAGAACAPPAAQAEAERVRTGVLAALDRLGRAPELYAVSPGGEVEPVPLSNRVQAWTVGARWAFENGTGTARPPAVPAASTLQRVAPGGPRP